MEIHSPPTTTPTPTPTTTTTTLDPDPDPQIQPNNNNNRKPFPPPYTNGVLKRLNSRHHHHNPVVITYKECLKNHAATIGGHAVDGCGEFMPSLTSSPTDPTSLKCAACGCHRNFHRRDRDGSFPTNPPVQHVIEYQPHHPPPPQPISVAGARDDTISPADSTSPPPISSSYYPSAPHMLLALSSGLPAPPSETTQFSSIPVAGKRRFRTKFTQHQKQKMHELAERMGWKMQKKDENIIFGTCNEIGVDKGVFKVWMHNNKMTFGGKKDSNNHHVGVDFINRNDDVSSGGGGGNVIGTNGSSSSS